MNALARPWQELFLPSFQRLESLFNPRLESVLQQRVTAEKSATAEATKEAAPVAAKTAVTKPEPAAVETKPDVKILKGLQGLSPQLLALIQAKEQAKQIKKMTQSNEEQKELELMEELLVVSSFLLFATNYG